MTSGTRSERVGLIVLLPDGGAMGGVTVWAESVTKALEQSDVCVSIVRSEGSIAACRDSFSEAIDRAGAQGISRLVLAPQLSAAAYSAAALVAAKHDDVSLVGFLHSMLRYDFAVLQRFEPVLSRVGCVSSAAADRVRRFLTGSKIDVIRTGVDDVDCVATGPAHTPLRLVYTGRLDAFQKRVLSLPLIVRGLLDRGIDVRLTVVGDGDTRAVLEARCAELPITLLGSLSREGTRALLAEHDVLLLPSRSEGLGLSRVEAGLAGCVPMVTPGGAAEGIEHGRSGLIAQISEDADDTEAAVVCVGTLERALDLDFGLMRAEARTSALAFCECNRFAANLEAFVLEAARVLPPRRILDELSRDLESTARVTVPMDATRRASQVLDHIELAHSSARVIVHGCGEHSQVIAPVLDRPSVVGFCDDDPKRWGTRYLGRPVVSPGNAGLLNATDVVISSWLHQDSIWQRRSMFSDVRVHRLYETAAEAASSHSGR